MAKKKKNKIEGQFVPLQHSLLKSKAYMSLSDKAKILLIYFMSDIKNSHETEVILTYKDAKKFNVCGSPTTFKEKKIELVKHGFLDSLDGGGLNAPSKFKLSYRWKQYGTDLFVEKEYIKGFGSKYFTTAWQDKKKREKLISARHKSF